MTYLSPCPWYDERHTETETSNTPTVIVFKTEFVADTSDLNLTPFGDLVTDDVQPPENLQAIYIEAPS